MAELSEGRELPAWRFWAIVVGSVVLLIGGVWYSQRPSYEELLERESVARAMLGSCQIDPYKSCAREAAAYEKAHARVLNATP